MAVFAPKLEVTLMFAPPSKAEIEKEQKTSFSEPKT